MIQTGFALGFPIDEEIALHQTVIDALNCLPTRIKSRHYP